jgi:hypothetical protein
LQKVKIIKLLENPLQFGSNYTKKKKLGQALFWRSVFEKDGMMLLTPG